MVRLLAATSLVASLAVAAPLRPVPLESANPDAEKSAACARASSLSDASLDAFVSSRSAAVSSLSIKAQVDSEDLRVSGCADAARAELSNCLKACLATRAPGLPGASALPTVSWESALLQGLAQFLAERAQSEVGVWFFERFGAQLCATTHEDEKAVRARRFSLFPETCELLSKPESGAAPGSLFTAALRSDLERLPGMALFSLDSTHAPALDPQRKALADGLFEVFSMLRRGGNPLETLAVFETDADLNEAADTSCRGNSQVGCLFQVVGFVTHYTKGLVSPTDRPEVERRLLEEKVKERFGTSDAKVLVDAIVRLIDTQRRWQQPPTSADDGLQRATTMLWHVGDLLSASATVAKVPDVAKVARVFTAASLTFRGDYAGALKELVLLGTDLFPPRLQKAVTLVADLANARDATSVASILDAQTAPVGSWRLKREGFSMSVTGLVGGGGGAEYALNAPMQKWGGSMGLFAQLGVDFTWAVGGNSTVGIMVTALDLGQLTWSRLDAVARGVDGPEPIPELGFAQVLSPGAYFVVGLGKSPVVFVLGASLAPQLRKYTVGGLTDESTVIRFNAGFSVDITLLPLVGRSYLEASK